METVQLYAQRGLLPGADDKLGYSEAHLDVVRFIGRIQAEHELPLDTIAAVLAGECHFDLALAERAVTALAEPDPRRAGPGPASLSGLSTRTGASQALVRALVDADLLPAQGPYGGHHVWIVEAAVTLSTMGLDAEQVEDRHGGVHVELQLETGAVAAPGSCNISSSNRNVYKITICATTIYIICNSH